MRYRERSARFFASSYCLTTSSEETRSSFIPWDVPQIKHGVVPGEVRRFASGGEGGGLLKCDECGSNFVIADYYRYACGGGASQP